MEREARTFEAWRRRVDYWLVGACGVGLDDLPDVALMEWYEDGTSPKAAARRALRYAREG